MRIVLIFLLLLSLNGCCKSKNEIHVGDYFWDLQNKYDRIYGGHRVASFQTEDLYTVVVTKEYYVEKVIEFTEGRKIKKVQGIKLIDSTDIKQFVGMRLSEVEKKYGKIHADVGSGIHVPSYITETGYLLMLDVDDCIIYNNEIISDGIVCDVREIDLLTGENVEYVIGIEE